MVIQLFSNAKEITINGKVVKSIILDGGGVLYEKSLDTLTLYLASEKETIKKEESTLLTASIVPPQENETVYINKIIDDENLNLELTSINDGLNHTIKAKVIDENDNGLENIRIKLFKEE